MMILALKNKKINKIIAVAIKEADNSYFHENYDKQAQAVIKSLEDSGYEILPGVSDENLIAAGVSAIPYGKNTPESIVKAIYKGILDFLKSK